MSGAGEYQVPADCVSLFDYERYARDRLPPDVWAYIAGYGADGLTQRANRKAYDSLQLANRVLTDMRGGTSEVRLFGQSPMSPILIAPVAFQKLAHPDGELATAQAASVASTGMVVSTQASHSLEDIAKVANTDLWFQLYFQADRQDTLDLVRRAEAANYRALVLTVDAPVNGVRNVEQRAAFRMPDHIRAVNLTTYKAAPPAQAGPGESPVFKGMLDLAPKWDDVVWIRQQTKLPILIKGIMHPDDAMKALDCGANGIIVSNHGGRTLDTVPPTLLALEHIARRLPSDAVVLVDGGVRRGTDVLKALALGAKAVLIGQPIMHALAVGGAVGVLHMLTVLKAEFEVAMALTGCRKLADITPDVLWRID